MRQIRTGCGGLLLGVGLGAGVACGDIGDAQVPLPLHDARSSERPISELSPAPSDATADDASLPQAVVSLSVAASEAGCPLAFEALLPDASAASTLTSGEGSRAITGRQALISCRVAARLFSEGVFELELLVLRDQLPLLRAQGDIGPAATGSLALEITLPDRGSLAARCPIQSTEVLGGAVWFHTLGCQTFEDRQAGASACDVELDAIFENCRQ